MWLGVKVMETKAKLGSAWRRIRGIEGATAVEYALMVALIAGVIVLTVQALGQKLNTEFSNVTAAMP